MSDQQSSKLSSKGKLAVFALLIAIGFIYSSGAQTPPQLTQQETVILPEPQEALVVFVIDGDTIMLDGGEKVRLIGINTPERGEDGYEEARDALAKLALNKTVTITPQQSDRDIYGRLLRDVYIEDIFVNLYLVENGFAVALPIPPDTKFAKEIHQAEQEFNKGL